jgi:apolipoprotein D and lipocalin family protein
MSHPKAMVKTNSENSIGKDGAFAPPTADHQQCGGPTQPIASVHCMKSFTVAVFLTLLSSCVSTQHGNQLPPLQTVSHVDLHRYVGLWYEIGRYPNSFQKGCQDSTAMYTVRPDGKIDVVNSCRNDQDGSLREAKGRAWVVDKNSNARLKVSFFWPFRGDYWIIDLGREYEYAVVGTPNRRYLWILSRTPEMHPDILEKIVQNVEKQGFVRSNLLLHNKGNLL